MMVYGYARVSSEGQSLTAQVAELKAAGCQRVFQEKISGARADRKQLARLLAELDDGDTVVVTRLDRLARSTRDLLNTLAAIGAANATFRSLHDAWATRPRRMGG
jgi:DNA invertase Pin-like site-specific DNA recombinase